MRARIAAVGVLAALLTGCSVTPAPIGAVTQTPSPRREALQYFPADAPIVALLHTDPTAPDVRRLVSSGALSVLRRFAADQKLHYAQYRGLLGNDAVVGQPEVGGPPMAVLVVPDSGYLDALAQARVNAHLARRAGEYRGAKFFQASDFAYAIRGAVLLVGGNVQQLVDALDTRVGDDSFDAGRMNAVLPEGFADAVLRAAVDLRPYAAAYLPAAAREIPLVRAATTAGVVVEAQPDRLEATLVADTAGTGLVQTDFPGEPGGTAVPLLHARTRATVGAANLGDTTVAIERAVKSALPVTALRFDAVVARLNATGVPISRDLLKGPATALASEAGPLVVWRAARPKAVALALRRAAKHYREPGVRIRREGDLYAVRAKGRLVLRVGLVDNKVVAGNAPRRTLSRLARTPVDRVDGGRVVVRVPRLADWLPHPVSLALAGSPDRITVRARTEP